MVIKKKGQSTLEYIILVTAVIVVILALVGQSNQGFQQTLQNTVNGVTTKMGDMSTRWQTAVGN